MARDKRSKNHRARPQGRSATDFQARQAIGDLTLQVAVDYERALRARWLLELRGDSASRLATFRGEDCRLTHADGSVTYRQVKKRDITRPWSPRDLKPVIGPALDLVDGGPKVRFEFYTNGRVHPDLVDAENGCILHAGNPQVAELLGSRDSGLCRRVFLFDRYEHTSARALQAMIRWDIEDLIQRAIDDTRPLMLVNVDEVNALAAGLIAAEPRLVREGDVTWASVDAEVGFERYLAKLRARIDGRAALVSMASFGELDGRALPADAHAALDAIRQHRSIERQPLERSVTEDVRAWVASSERPPIRGSVVLGAHGSGRTHLLMRVLKALAEVPGLHIHLASHVVPNVDDIVPSLGLRRTKPIVLLIDDVSEEWMQILSLPSSTYGGIYFIATSTPPRAAPDLEFFLRNRRPDVTVFELPQALSRGEIDDLSRCLRPALPSGPEARRAARTNIRGAAAIFERGESGPAFEQVPQLAEREQEVLVSVLVCSAMGIAAPKAVIEKRCGRAIPGNVLAHLVQIRKGHSELVIHESQEVANELLDDHLGAARSALEIPTYVDELIAHADPEIRSERAFVRHVLRVVSARDPVAARHLVHNRKRSIRLILEKESDSSLAYAWFPLVGGFEPELDEACLRPLTRSPRTAAQFSLFLRFYGAPDATKLLQKALATRTDWDGWMLAEAATMIVKLPFEEQRDLGRSFSQLLFDLPPVVFFDACTRGNGFTTMIRLLAEHGMHLDRDQAMRLVNVFFRLRADSRLPVNSSWVESYLKLSARTMLQQRNGIALAICRDIADGQGEGPARERALRYREQYREILEKETRISVDGIVSIGKRWFDDVTEFRQILGTVKVPGNILKLVALWGTPDEKRQVAGKFLAYVEALSGRVPLERMASLLFSGLRLVDMGATVEQRRSFARVLLRWTCAPPPRRGEAARLSFYVLSHVAGGLFEDANLTNGARHLLGRAIFEPERGASTWGEVLRELLDGASTAGTNAADPPWPPLREWSSDVVLAFLRATRFANRGTRDVELGRRIWEYWRDAKGVSRVDLAFTLGAFGLADEAADLVEPLTKSARPSVAALQALAAFELLRGRRQDAYATFARSMLEGDRRRCYVSPRHACNVQRVFLAHADRDLAPLHALCVALSQVGRLAPLPE